MSTQNQSPVVDHFDGKRDLAMYRLINQFADKIVGSIPQEYVTEYEWLLENISEADTPQYQQRYRYYWSMNAAQLGPAFYAAYFNALKGAHDQAPKLDELLHTLYD